jgi:ribosomal protein L7/L12
MQQCTDNDTTMPESKRTVLTQAVIDWAECLGYTLTSLDIDEAIYFTRRGQKIAAIKDVRKSARPVGITKPFKLITGNGFSDFIDGRGITYTELPAAMGLKQAKDIVDMLEANITL